MGQKIVRTAAGARRYGVPIGSPIGSSGHGGGAVKAAMKAPAASPPHRSGSAIAAFSAGVGKGRLHSAASRPIGRSLSTHDERIRAAYKAAGIRADPRHGMSVQASRPSATRIPTPAAPQTSRPRRAAPTGDAAVEARVRHAYAELRRDTNYDLVALSRLRTRLPDVPREELDRILKAMDRRRDIQLDADPNRKSLLPPEAHAAAIRLGGENRHLISIQQPMPKSAKASPPAPPRPGSGNRATLPQPPKAAKKAAFSATPKAPRKRAKPK